MSNGLKALGALGVGGVLVLGVSTMGEGSTDSSSESKCHPSYSGCLKMGVGDYDCRGGSGNGPNYTGRVRVEGSDPFDLDRDNDGWGCE